MPKRRAKKASTKSASSHANNTKCDGDTTAPSKEDAFDEVERQCAAIRAIRDVEIERLLTALRLLRSNISKQQLQTSVLQFCEEFLPNVAVIRTENDGPYILKWKDKDGDLSMNTADGGNLISSFLQHMSMAYPEGSAAIPSLGKTSFIGTDNLHKDIVLEEPLDPYFLGRQDSLRTPGASISSQRLSVGMTPKSVRLPKQGEMLLSVHGSPLGVFKDNNMDAIHETEEE